MKTAIAYTRVFTAQQGKSGLGLDLPHQMIFENGSAKTKLAKQLTLVTLQTARSRIDLAENRVKTTESRFVVCLNRLLQHNRPITKVVMPTRAHIF